jgi:hypothetical protein
MKYNYLFVFFSKTLFWNNYNTNYNKILIGLYIPLREKRKKGKQIGKDCGNSICIIKTKIMVNNAMSKSSMNTCW